MESGRVQLMPVPSSGPVGKGTERPGAWQGSWSWESNSCLFFLQPGPQHLDPATERENWRKRKRGQCVCCELQWW